MVRLITSAKFVIKILWNKSKIDKTRWTGHDFLFFTTKLVKRRAIIVLVAPSFTTFPGTKQKIAPMIPTSTWRYNYREQWNGIKSQIEIENNKGRGSYWNAKGLKSWNGGIKDVSATTHNSNGGSMFAQLMRNLISNSWSSSSQQGHLTLQYAFLEWRLHCQTNKTFNRHFVDH